MTETTPRRRQSMFVVRPHALAGTRWEPVTALGFGLAVAGIVVAEIATPNDVVGVTGFLPVIVAMWVLSSRFATAVGAFAAACFALVLLIESGNRPTVICIGAVGLVIAVTIRLYAAALTNLRAGVTDFAVISDDVDTLTPREHQVARLAARGLSASEIAQHLHISERTVESHLANAYAKLGIHSRAALRKIGERLVDG